MNESPRDKRVSEREREFCLLSQKVISPRRRKVDKKEKRVFGSSSCSCHFKCGWIWVIMGDLTGEYINQLLSHQKTTDSHLWTWDVGKSLLLPKLSAASITFQARISNRYYDHLLHTSCYSNTNTASPSSLTPALLLTSIHQSEGHGCWLCSSTTRSGAPPNFGNFWQHHGKWWSAVIKKFSGAAAAAASLAAAAAPRCGYGLVLWWSIGARQSISVFHQREEPMLLLLKPYARPKKGIPQTLCRLSRNLEAIFFTVFKRRYTRRYLPEE